MYAIVFSCDAEIHGWDGIAALSINWAMSNIDNYAFYALGMSHWWLIPLEPFTHHINLSTLRSSIKLTYMRLNPADHPHSDVSPTRVFCLRWNCWLSHTAAIQHQPLPLLATLRTGELLVVSASTFPILQCAEAQGSRILLFHDY